MGVFDKRLQFSDQQSVAANGASTNTIDLGSPRDIGVGEPMYVVVAARSGSATDFVVALQMDDNSGFASPTTKQTSETVATFAAGQKIVMPVPHGTSEQHLRLSYTRATGTVVVDAFLTNQEPTAWKAYANAID